MIKFDVICRISGEVKFTADIDCAEDAPRSAKLGLAVKWGLKNNANLPGANLSDANLSDANLWNANLSGANLRNADLWNANLRNADLWNANLRNANLWNANLSGANLPGANLSDADLRNANLRNANLRNANLWNANLRNANLSGANLPGANLSDANLRNANLWNANLSDANLWNANLNGAHGVNDWVKCIQIDQYAISYTSDILQIGCQRHLITKWRDFDDKRIAGMDGNAALKFWRKYKDWIFQTIELCPAKPTVGASK